MSNVDTACYQYSLLRTCVWSTTKPLDALSSLCSGMQCVCSRWNEETKDF